MLNVQKAVGGLLGVAGVIGLGLTAKTAIDGTDILNNPVSKGQVVYGVVVAGLVLGVGVYMFKTA